MELEEFVRVFADIFEETSGIAEETVFAELEEWSSLTVLSVIAMVKEEFNVDITADEMQTCDTVKELFSLIKEKR